MPGKELKRRPERYEDVKGIGPKRAERLREDLGPYEEWAQNSANYQKNTIAKTVSGNRRNLPEFAENAIQASRGERQAVDAVDQSLVSVKQGRTVKSKTVTKARAEEADRSDLGFSTQERGEREFRAAFDLFREEYEGPFDVSARDLGQAADDDTRATGQPLIGAATSRVTFARGAQPEDLKSEIETSVQNVSKKRPAKSPGELADDFTGFVEDQIGFGRDVGEFSVSAPDMIEAQDVHDDRSMEARRVDNQRRAPVTTNVERWKSDPSGLDFPGVDTPTSSPQASDRDLL